DEPHQLLTITENGYGKRTPLSEYRIQNRNGQGIIDIRTGARNGQVAGALVVDPADKVMLITDTGRVIKVRVEGIRETNRATKGVTVMRVEDDEHIVSIARVVETDDDEADVIDAIDAPESADDDEAGATDEE
ncbi:MAG: DNA gyrase C-terminal beta-propeller domain-containing protein, partial [Myxococcota bacterium]|nr:DNA gyrase C-terminal beta-propeller domain-containing protein [Myxococcota bacterium]